MKHFFFSVGLCLWRNANFAWAERQLFANSKRWSEDVFKASPLLRRFAVRSIILLQRFRHHRTGINCLVYRLFAFTIYLRILSNTFLAWTNAKNRRKKNLHNRFAFIFIEFACGVLLPMNFGAMRPNQHKCEILTIECIRVKSKSESLMNAPPSCQWFSSTR